MVWTLQEAKHKFSTVVDAALTGTPQGVSRRGKTAIVVLSDADYQRLVEQAVESREQFADHLLTFPVPEIEHAQATPRDVDF
ncbi:MAG: type II toxin-antitoxin system prevent-host-death family antitoxin [Pelagimonas sp.]|jgi:prevent-host-death family protein|nr:type II toxin-antitoxin system prevent-host-death family antitoxin [Pelagimonas sp.]